MTSTTSARRRLGMWMFLLAEILFFGGLFATYAVYRWPTPRSRRGHHLDVTLGASIPPS
jgi:cytochrome c oxidase subunit 3